MKSGNFLGGLTLGLLLGGGIGYVLGMDSEKKNQLLHFISDKLGIYDSDELCDCEEELMEMQAEAEAEAIIAAAAVIAADEAEAAAETQAQEDSKKGSSNNKK